ncbi:MAG: cupredoxin domain-containing protein, partial [Dehalococcoidia bacterium]
AVLAGALFALPRHVSVARADDPTLISMVNNLYAPNTVTIAAGTTVVWSNDEDPNAAGNTHDVIEDSSSFYSDYLNAGDSYSYTFSTPGTYHYFCDLHDNMDGYVVVQ